VNVRSLIVLVLLCAPAFADDCPPASEHDFRRMATELLDEAECYAKRAQFREAADRFERYAKIFAGERNALDAMTRAIRYRAGDREKRIENTKFFVKMYGAKRWHEASAMMFELQSAYEGDELVKHLRQYIREFGGRDRALALRAHVTLGRIAWQRSCRSHVDGLCVKLAPADGASCSAKPHVIALARDPKQMKEALASFEAAIKIFDDHPPIRVVDGVLAAYATAKLALADRDLEALLAMPFPKLSFRTPGSSRRSHERFQRWLDEQRGEALAKQYQAIRELKEPNATLASVAREGQHLLFFAARFLASKPPHDMLAGGAFRHEKREAYCKTLDDHMQGVRDRAVERFTICAMKANELGILNDWSRLCLRALEREQPDDFPKLVELYAKPR
jgi:hypothetical protein